MSSPKPSDLKELKEEPAVDSRGVARFDSMESIEASDHHYKDRENPVLNTKFAAKILKEWEILRRSLPEGVYVKSYEDRIDLLKILIIGPPGTPYHNCIFVFDMHMPSDYPNSPPDLHFRSQGPKLNPNLYTNGRVCLSLLGTWTGKGTENWIEGESSIHQLVVSIQGLILGSQQPYFLEAGYDRLKGTVQGEHHSKLYNENAYILALETIPITIKNPPEDFKDIVNTHFKNKKEEIIAECKSFVDGKLSASNSSDELNSNSNSAKSDGKSEETALKEPSRGFIVAIEQLIPKLEESFKVYE